MFKTCGCSGKNILNFCCSINKCAKKEKRNADFNIAFYTTFLLVSILSVLLGRNIFSMLLLPRLAHCFKLATSTYQHPVERCLVWFYWRSLSSADTADHVGICSFLLAYPKEVHKPISKQNSTEFPAHSASFHTFPSGESLL